MRSIVFDVMLGLFLFGFPGAWLTLGVLLAALWRTGSWLVTVVVTAIMVGLLRCRRSRWPSSSTA